MIQLRFLIERGIEAAIIRKVTRSPYSHVDIVMPNGFLASYDPKGVQLYPLDYIKPIRADIGTVACNDAQTAAILAWAQSKVGKAGYDYAAIFGDLFMQDWTQKGTFDCSAYVQCACLAGNFPLLKLNYTKWVNPGQLASSPLISWNK